MKKFEVKDHEASILPDGEWKLVWSDEFDGTELDRTKWDYRRAMMGHKWESWTDKGVTLDGKSNAVFRVVEENGLPVSSQLQTGYNFMDEPADVPYDQSVLTWRIGKLKENLYTKQYGYFECRCRLQKKEGWWSAFWIQSPMIGASLDSAESGTEIDVMESFKPGEIHPHFVFSHGYGADKKKECVGGKLNVDVDEFHRFGVLWDENGYTFYVDGVEDGHIGNYVSKRPEFILISTEVGGYRGPKHRPKPEAFDLIGNDEFLVDYVRVFDRVK